MKTLILGALVAMSVTAPGWAQTAALSGKWEFSTASDPLTDAKRGFATLTSASGAVLVKCDVNGPGSVYMMIAPAPPYLGPRNGGRTVNVRLDDGPVTDDTWEYSSDYLSKISAQTLAKFPALAGMGGATVNELAPKFASAKKLVFRVFDYKFSTVDVLLTSDGDPSAVAKVYATCGDSWPGAAP